MDWKAVSWNSAITSVLAIYGAGLSTYNIIAKNRESRRVIKVSMKYGWPVFGQQQLGDDCVFVEATNPGNRAVTLASVTIRLANGRQLVIRQTSSELPHELQAGNNVTAWVGLDQLKATLRDEHLSGDVWLKGIYRDAVGAEYKSKPFKVEVR